MKVASVAEMRAKDFAVMKNVGITEETLMENAGLAAFSLLAKKFSPLSAQKITIVCSTGNNGGDGFVLARQLHATGCHVTVLLLGDEAKCKGAAKKNLAIVRGINGCDIKNIIAKAQALNIINSADIVVDSIFGTGLNRAVVGIFRDIIILINQRAKIVLSLDIPSGINGDTGAIMGEAVQADFTVTFGLIKKGLLLYPGFAHCGKLYLSRISFPISYCEDEKITVATNSYIPLSVRAHIAHKKTVGDALFIAGSANYYGAPYFAAASFMRAGGGYARLATVPSIISAVAQLTPETVFLPLAETAGAMTLRNLGILLEFSQKADIVVIGSGISLNEQAQTLAREFIKKASCPLVIDGDGISALAKEPRILQKRKAVTIITPHTGEMARLTGATVVEIEANRIEVSQATAKSLNAYIVLKGAHSLIAAPDGQVFINLTGNAGMATAGVGDVLTGVIAGCFCSGIAPVDAVRKGVYLHGLAGDIAAAQKSEEGMIAGDILENIPTAIIADKKRNGNFADIEII